MATPHESPTVPVPLEQYVHGFDDLFHTHIQCRHFREYLAGLLLPRDRTKTLTALVGAEPITQAQTAPVQAARAAGIPFRAVVADSLYGEHPEFTRTLWQADIPCVLAVKPSEVVWTPPPEPESPWEAADRLRWGPRNDARHPGAWTAVGRRFHDGHEQTWWAVELRLGGTYGPDRSHRLGVAPSNPRTLPKARTWDLG